MIDTTDRQNVGGVFFALTSYREVIERILAWKAAGHRGYVVLANPHSVLTAQRNPAMLQAVRDASLVLPDGIGIVLGARMLGETGMTRVSGPTLVLQTCRDTRTAGLRHLFIGGTEGVAAKMCRNLTRRCPGLRVAGVLCPSVTDAVASPDPEIIHAVNAADPDIVWVGLGAPKQEIWMWRARSAIHATVMIGVGAAFDFHAGTVRWAPEPVRRIGLEWAFRLFQEPRRLWRRNLDSGPLFLLRVLRQRCFGAFPVTN